MLVAVTFFMTVTAAPAKKEANFDRAYKCYESQDWNNAVDLFNAAIKENDRVMEANAFIGSIKAEQGDLKSGINYLSKSIKMMDDDADPIFKAWVCSELSEAYLENKDLNKAFDYMNTACELVPDDAHYLVERSVICFKMHKYNEALTDADKALTLSPEQEDKERAQAMVRLCKSTIEGNNIEENEVVEVRDVVASDEAVMPEFPGGFNAMKQFIAKKIKYPKKAKKSGIEGNVIVECSIDTKGKMTDAKVIESVDPDLDKEALRVCRSMPKFSPGSIKGTPVSSTVQIQVKFRINK